MQETHREFLNCYGLTAVKMPKRAKIVSFGFDGLCLGVVFKADNTNKTENRVFEVLFPGEPLPYDFIQNRKFIETACFGPLICEVYEVLTDKKI